MGGEVYKEGVRGMSRCDKRYTGTLGESCLPLFDKDSVSFSTLS